jgi:hypothetical protein
MSKQSIEALRQKMNHSSGHEKDFDLYYGKLLFNEKGNAGIIIRPISIDDETPIVQRFGHAWKSPQGSWSPARGGFIVDCCSSSIGEPCPVCESVEKLRSTFPALAKERKSKVNYVSNIVVMADPMRPANVGRVVLINLPKVVAEKLLASNDPNLYPPEGFDAWDPIGGRNFMLKVTKTAGQWLNYDYSASAFVAQSSSLGCEDKITSIITQCVPLASILVPSYSYSECADKYRRATSGGK